MYHEMENISLANKQFNKLVYINKVCCQKNENGHTVLFEQNFISGVDIV